MEDRCYIAIDMKSFYASVECVHRGLDPLKAHLLVADESRSDNTICLAVSPSLKAIGVPSRPRLFEAKQAVKRYEADTGKKVPYIIAVPRMREYEKASADIYSIYLRYAAAEDIHVYSIDECFIDCTHYLHLYKKEALRTGQEPAYLMAMTIIRDVLKTTGITATVGIGTNLYLAKIAMDIVAKKAKPDKDGVRIAFLDENTYRAKLWEHRPITDFWQIGRGKARTLENNFIFTMGDIAERSQWNEEWFYKIFGVDAEILIDHAWGIEPVRMCDIKNYRSDNHSLSNGQVLSRPYEYNEARNVLCEMVESLCFDMYQKGIVSGKFAWYVGYDYKSMESCPAYDGPIVIDSYGRVSPKYSKGVITLEPTNAAKEVIPLIAESFDKLTDHRLLYRRLNIAACDTKEDSGIVQLSLFTDEEEKKREQRLYAAMSKVRARFGANAVLKANDLLSGATSIERNNQIGGHRA
ncbi:MAG: DNA methylase [Lachnospiraceae bacterium]|nr:DNA methylase [Lachnospiraceae bacterium]